MLNVFAILDSGQPVLRIPYDFPLTSYTSEGRTLHIIVHSGRIERDFRNSPPVTLNSCIF